MSYTERRVAKCRKKTTPDPTSEKCKQCQDRFYCFTTGSLAITVVNAKTRYIFEVPNDEEGQQFLKLAKKFLNSNSWSMKKRGRNSNRKEVLGGKYRPYTQNDIPIGSADWFALYFNYKKGRKGFEETY